MGKEKMMPFAPRLIRLRDAPAYLGMDIKRFNHEVRSNFMEIPIGDRGIAFDRLDLDAWANDYKDRMGRPNKQRRTCLWDENERQASGKGGNIGTLKNRYTDDDLTKVLERAASKKRSKS